MDITPEERARAIAFAHRHSLEALWNVVLSRFDEPMEEAKAIEADILQTMEAELSLVRGRDAEVTQHLAITVAEDSWKRIRAQLASQAEPIPYEPTQAAIDAFRAAQDQSSEDDTSGTHEAPDR